MALIVNRVTEQDQLLHRPRVSACISEYVIGYISTNILAPLKIMQSEKGDYSITLAFGKYLPGIHKINSISPYATDTVKFITHDGFSIVNQTTRLVFIKVEASYLDETIQPCEYAILVYELFASYLLRNFKRVKKEVLDEYQAKLDFELIESFPFPAPFEEQRYNLDNGRYTEEWQSDFATNKDTKWIVPAEVYKKHFGF